MAQWEVPVLLRIVYIVLAAATGGALGAINHVGASTSGGLGDQCIVVNEGTAVCENGSICEWIRGDWVCHD